MRITAGAALIPTVLIGQPPLLLEITRACLPNHDLAIGRCGRRQARLHTSRNDTTSR